MCTTLPYLNLYIQYVLSSPDISRLMQLGTYLVYTCGPGRPIRGRHCMTRCNQVYSIVHYHIRYIHHIVH